METIKIIANTVQSEQRIKSLLNLLVGDNGHYSYYAKGSLFYIIITIYFDSRVDMFPFDSLQEFLKCISYDSTDSVMVFKGNGMLFTDLVNSGTRYHHSDIGIQKMEAPTGEVFEIKPVYTDINSESS